MVRNDPAALPVREGSVPQPRHTHTQLAWEVYPPALTDVLLWVKERYGDIPLYITENGAAFYDPPTARDGCIDDPLRVAYLADHIRAVRPHLAVKPLPFDLQGAAIELLWPAATDDDAACRFVRDQIVRLAGTARSSGRAASRA